MSTLSPPPAATRILQVWRVIFLLSIIWAAPASAQNGEIDERIAEWRRDAQIMLTAASDPAAADLLPEGIRTNELAMRRRDLEQTLLAIGRHEKAIAATAEHERARDEAEVKLTAWTRFDHDPPFSILELDLLENERDSVIEERAAIESSISIMDRAMDNLLTEEAASAENLRRRNNEANRGGDDASWRAESARINSRQVQTRKMALTSNLANLANLRTQLATADAELALVQRQIGMMVRDVVFTDEDFEAITKAGEQRKNNLREELAALRARYNTAAARRDQAFEARERLLAANPDATSAIPEFAEATAWLFTAEATTDSLQTMMEAIEWLLQIEAYQLSAQEERRVLFDSEDRAERASAIESIRTMIDRLSAWEIVANNEIATVAAALTAVETRVAALGEDDSRIPALNQRRAILLERQTIVHRIARSVASHRALFTRWISAYETRERTATELVGDKLHAIIDGGRRLMAVEILTYQKGEGEEGQRSVTLRDLLFALLVVLIPYFILGHIVRRVQRTTIAMQLIGEAQANTLRNWLMIVFAFLLTLIALNFLDIPLTVFAFFGGALAIGLGFGMQTLIKNFISGIIMLFERRIRVGDIIEVDGSIGSVTEINTRSSVIRNADGLETMIPNSLFLENRVTNLTLTNRCNRRCIRVGVAYGTSPAKVMDALRECVDRHGLVLKTPEPLVLFEDFGDSALMFAVYFWVEFNDRTNALQVASDLRIMIEKRLGELGIGIPFPQRDLHLASENPLTVRLERRPPEPSPQPEASATPNIP